jgi:hypothetical protein
LNITLESFSFVFWDLALIFEVIMWDLNMNWLKWQTKLKKKTYMGWKGVTLGGEVLMGFEPSITLDSWRKSGTLVKPLRLRGVWPVPRLCVLHPAISLTTAGKSTEKTSVRVVKKCHWLSCLLLSPALR